MNIKAIIYCLKQLEVEAIDLVIVTHYDEDHLGGIVSILEILSNEEPFQTNKESY